MENSKDFDYIKEKFDTLPEITLPSSLTAESLWARMDAGGFASVDTGGDAPAQDVSHKKAFLFDEIANRMRRMRPVLSYAAVFVVMVAVYYSAGLDSAPPAPAAAAPQMMMASPPMQESGENAPEGHNKSRMAGIGDDTSFSSSQDQSPMMAAAPTPEDYSDDAQANPDTNGLNPEEEPAEEYTKMLDNAIAMEKYLLSELSPKDYGGMYLMQTETVALNIWVVNQDSIQAALIGYPGEQCEVVTEAARCSLEDLKLFSGILERIQLADGEMLRAYVSEIDNAIAVNISKAGEDRLKQRISELVQENAIPAECVTVFTIDPAAPNIGA